MDHTSKWKYNSPLPTKSQQPFHNDSDCRDIPNEPCVISDDDGVATKRSFSDKCFTNKIPHDSGVSRDMKEGPHEGMYFNYTSASHVTVDDVNEEIRRKNEIGNDETHELDAETSSVESPRDVDDGLESVHVDPSYPDIEMKTFNSKDRLNARIRHNNDMCYDEAVHIDDDVNLGSVVPHRTLYHSRDVQFTPNHDGDFDDDEYDSSQRRPQEVDNHVVFPLKSSTKYPDYGTTSKGVRIEKHERPLKADGPPFEFPLDEKSIERSFHNFLPSSPSSRGRLEEGRANDSLIARDSSLDSGTKKANKKKKKKTRDEDEFDVNGNPKEGSTSEYSSNDRRHQKSSFPCSIGDLPDSDKREDLSESEKRGKKSGKKHVKLANKNIKESVLSEQVQGHRGDVGVDELVNFINNNQGNKKKKKLDGIEGPQNGPAPKTAPKKVKKSRSLSVRSVEDEAGAETGVEIEDCQEISAEVEKLTQEAKQFVKETRALPESNAMLALNMVPSMPSGSLGTHPTNSLPEISVEETLEEPVKPELILVNHVAATKARTTKDKASDKATLKPGDKATAKDSDKKVSNQGSKSSANNKTTRNILKSDNYKFTDIPISPKEEEFTVVSTKKKKRPTTISSLPVALNHGLPSHHSVPNFQQVNSFQPREHVSRDLRRYSPPTRSVTPPPMSVSSPSPDKPAERAFSPSAFPVLGGRRNSTGNVALELNPEDSDMESVKSLPLGPSSATSQDGALSPPATGATMSYAKIAAQPRGKQPQPAPNQVPNTQSSTCAANGPDANVLSTKSQSTPADGEPVSAASTEDCKTTVAPEESSLISSAPDPSGKPSAGSALSASTVYNDMCVCPGACTPCAGAAMAPPQPKPQAASTPSTVALVPVTNHKKQRQKGVVFLKRDSVPMPRDIGISFGFEVDPDLKDSPVLCGVAAHGAAPRTYPTVEKVVPASPPLDTMTAGSVDKDMTPRHKNIFPAHTAPPSGIVIEFGFDASEVAGQEQGDRQPPDGEEGHPVSEDRVMADVTSVPNEQASSPEQPAPVESPPTCSSVRSTTSDTSSAGSDSGYRSSRRQVPMPTANMPGKPVMANGPVLPHPMQGQAIFATPPPPPLLNIQPLDLCRGPIPNMNAFLPQFQRMLPPAHQMHYMSMLQHHHHQQQHMMAQMGLPIPPHFQLPPEPLPQPPTPADKPLHDSPLPRQEDTPVDVTCNASKISPPCSEFTTSAAVPPRLSETAAPMGAFSMSVPPPANPEKTSVGLAWLPNLRQEDDPNFVRGKFHLNEAVAYLKREWDRTMEREQRDPSSVMRLDVRTNVTS